MRKLFEFLYRYRAFIFFIILEIFCSWLIVKNNTYQGVAYLNSSNKVVGQMMATTNSVNEFMDLRQTNYNLAMENAKLNSLIKSKMLDVEQQRADTMKFQVAGLTDTLPSSPDTLRKDSVTKAGTKPKAIKETVAKTPEKVQLKYNYAVAKVINNSIDRFQNFITINKGTKDGLRPGMGIVAPEGIVGRIRNCSENFCTATSVLHSAMSVSSKIKNTNAYGSLRWDGTNPYEANLLYIARHNKPKVGDTIVTTGYNNIFPEGIMVGVINNVDINDDDTFYKITLSLSTNFNSLTYVYVIENTLKPEQDSLEAININPQLKK